MFNLLKPLVRSTIPRYIMYSMRYSNACANPKSKISPGLAKIRALQAKFQEDNEKPIFLKGGALDNILYRTTWLLVIIGLLLDVKLYIGYILF